MKLKIVFLLCMAFFSAASVAQQDDSTHAKAVGDMLTAVGFVDATLAGLDKNAAPSSPNRQFVQHMRAHTTQEDVLRRFVPVFVPLISEAGARQIATAYRTPHGQKAASYNVARVQAPKGVVPRGAFSARDVQLVRTFHGTAPARAFATLDRQAAAVIDAAMRRWVNEYQDTLFQHAQDALAAHEATYDLPAMKEPTPFIPVTLDISYIDELAALQAERSFRRAHAEWKVGVDVKALGVREVLTPARLVSTEGNASSLAALDKIGARYVAFFAELDALEKDFAAAAGKISVSNGNTFAPVVEKGMTVQLGWNARYAANQRRILAAMRAVVVYAVARQGQFVLQDGKIAARTDAELAVLKALQGSLAREWEARDALDAEIAKQRAGKLSPKS